MSAIWPACKSVLEQWRPTIFIFFTTTRPLFFTWDFFCCSAEGKSSIQRLNKVKRLTLESLGIWPVLKKKKKYLLENIYKETPHCWTLFFKPSTLQLLQKLVHQPLRLFQLLNPHCPFQSSHCQLRMLTSGCKDQICATRGSGETFTEIQWVCLTQRCRAEITEQIIRPHIT